MGQDKTLGEYGTSRVDALRGGVEQSLPSRARGNPSAVDNIF